MIITDKAVFLQLAKSASTSMQRLVKWEFGGQQFGKHSRLEIAPVAETLGKPVVGGVRNPFAWYLSLWKFGCTQRGISWVCSTVAKQAGQLPDSAVNRLRHGDVPVSEVTHSRHLECEEARDPALWQALYADRHDAGAFRQWLWLIHQPEHRFNCFPEYGYTQYYPDTGLFSHVFLQLYSRENNAVYSGEACFDTDNLLPDILVRQEAFSNDIIKALADTGHVVKPEVAARIHGAEKVNSTADAGERSVDLSDFYDNASLNLVAQKDAKLIAAMKGNLAALCYGPLEVTATPQGQ